MPDMTNMTLDQVTVYKTELKDQINALAAERLEVSAREEALINEEGVNEARAQMQKLADASGRSLDEEAEFWQRRLTTEGDVGRWVQSNLVLGKDAYEGIATE
jgi:hypothetical protein